MAVFSKTARAGGATVDLVKTNSAIALLATVLVVMGALPATVVSPKWGRNIDDQTATAAPKHPVLVNSCVVTSNVGRLVKFYKDVLLLQPRTLTNEYAEFATGVGCSPCFPPRRRKPISPDQLRRRITKASFWNFASATLTASTSDYRGLFQCGSKGQPRRFGEHVPFTFAILTAISLTSGCRLLDIGVGGVSLRTVDSNARFSGFMRSDPRSAFNRGRMPAPIEYGWSKPNTVAVSN